MLYLYCCVVLLVVICRASHLSGLNRIRHWFSHFCIVSISCCRVHSNLIFRYRKQSLANCLVVDFTAAALQVVNSSRSPPRSPLLEQDQTVSVQLKVKTYNSVI
jgi:hypothetical protein